MVCELIYRFINYKYRDPYSIIGVCVAVRNKNLNKTTRVSNVEASNIEESSIVELDLDI
jgi:hypothetical protein